MVCLNAIIKLNVYSLLIALFFLTFECTLVVSLHELGFILQGSDHYVYPI